MLVDLRLLLLMFKSNKNAIPPQMCIYEYQKTCTRMSTASSDIIIPNQKLKWPLSKDQINYRIIIQQSAIQQWKWTNYHYICNNTNKVHNLYDSILYEILKRKAKLNYSVHQDTGYLWEGGTHTRRSYTKVSWRMSNIL